MSKRERGEGRGEREEVPGVVGLGAQGMQKLSPE